MRKKSNKVQLESVKDKSTLVKLLAEEDVTVSYQKVPTASFNIITREVTLPIWKDKSETVMDMMSLHEVGHALYTPVDMLEKGAEKKIKHSFLNVLEDVRIEKMIQDKYMGSIGVFKKAYKELISKDFFGVQDKELSKLNLIDRINMHYKNVPDVPFDDDELVWVKKSNQTKTSDDVINLAVELQEFMKESEKENESDKEFEVESAMSSDGSDGLDSEEEMKDLEDQPKPWPERPDVDTSDDEKSESGSTKIEGNNEEEEKEVEVDMPSSSKSSEDGTDESISATTDTNYQKKQFESVDPDARRINYLNIPKINLKNAIIDYKEVNFELTDWYAERTRRGRNETIWFDWIKEDIVRFKKEQKQTVSYMVKEFEMKKAADLYKRSTVSKTGALNMDKLHSYAYNEDIFLKMNIEPGATSHGLVMFVDWSGSMVDNFHNTIKQTMNLVWFCERVNIPFEVYGFTNGYGRRGDTNKNIFMQERKHNDLIVNDLLLLNLLSSRANKKEMKEGLENLWAISNYYGEMYGIKDVNSTMPDDAWNIHLPEDYSLYSTPLNNALVVAMDLLPKFKKDNGVQKVHTVFLTDGASNMLDSKYEHIPGVVGEGEVMRVNINGNYDRDRYNGQAGQITRITDPVTKKTWSTEVSEPTSRTNFSYSNQTPVLIEFLKNRMPGMNVVNFFIASKSKSGLISRNDIEDIFDLKWGEDELVKKIQKELKTQNVAVCKNQAWTEMYVLPGGVRLDTTSEDMSDVEVGAPKRELKKAFSKMSSGRKASRPLLNKFIGMIA